MNCVRFFEDENHKKECKFLERISNQIEKFIESNKMQMFVKIPVEEFGGGMRREQDYRFDRFVRVVTETICQYYHKEFKRRNEMNFNHYARMPRDRNAGVTIVNNQIIQPNSRAVNNIINGFCEVYDNNDALPEKQLNGNFLVRTYTNISGGMFSMPNQQNSRGLNTPYYVGNRKDTNLAKGFDIVIVIGDRFYSGEWLQDWFQDRVNRRCDTKIIVMGTICPNNQYLATDNSCCQYCEIPMEDIEGAYDFKSANIIQHSVEWKALSDLRDFVAKRLNDNDITEDYIVRMLLKPFRNNINIFSKERYESYLNWLYANNELLRYSDEITDISAIIGKCEELGMFTSSPKNATFNKIITQTDINELCVFNIEPVENIQGNQFIKVVGLNSYPQRGVSRNCGKRLFVLNSPSNRVLDLLQRYCIRGNIHVLSYAGFDMGNNMDTKVIEYSEDMDGYWETTNRPQNANPQLSYKITTDDNEDIIISGNIICENRIISIADFYEKTQEDGDKDGYEIIYCSDDSKLLDRFIEERHKIKVEQPKVSWSEKLSQKLKDDFNNNEKNMWNVCKKDYGYTSTLPAFRKYFGEDKPEYPGKKKDVVAILKFLGLGEDDENSIKKAVWVHNHRGPWGREMHNEVLSYQLTNQNKYVNEDYKCLLHRVSVRSIKRV